MTETPSKSSITIKKYANRRLYNTSTSSYVTLEDLSQMVKDGTEFNVYDAKTSEDITRSVLTQIIVEEESKSGQQNLLPIGFLRQLIAFYGDSLQWMVPKYLEQSMTALTGNQDQIRDYFQTTFGNLFPFGSTLEEMSKQNLAMFERTMRLFTPFGTDSDGNSTVSTTTVVTSRSVTPATEVKTAPLASVTPIKARVEEPKAETVAATPKPTPVKAETKAVETTSVAKSTPTPAASTPQINTPMPNVQTATSTASTGADDMQKKIANLQRQLADLAKSRA